MALILFIMSAVAYKRGYMQPALAMLAAAVVCYGVDSARRARTNHNEGAIT